MMTFADTVGQFQRRARRGRKMTFLPGDGRIPDAGPTAFFDIQPAGSSELLTITQAARVLAISASGMRRAQQARRIPFYRVGRSIRFARADLARYLSENRIEPPG